jgi:hypothetical protein
MRQSILGPLSLSCSDWFTGAWLALKNVRAAPKDNTLHTADRSQNGQNEYKASPH